MDNNKMIWFNDNIQYLINDNIMEYDMKAASVSICEYYNLLDKETIERLKLMTKANRTRQMGLFQREDKEFSQTLLEKIREVRGKFIEQNHLTDDNIISLHSDAIIFASKDKIKGDVDGIKFVKKSNWNSYIRYDKIEIFYNNGIIEYKGITEEMRQTHTLGMQKYIIEILNYLENKDPEIFRYLSKFQKKYLQDQLPEFYYHAFGKLGDYKLSNLDFIGYMTNIVLNEMKGW